ncbi:hypothetical protein [Rhodospirillum sp. A1_3_36]|uniref:hypothetical protein n=1 Tax=Rhodospirillum sp. A1_3_36 TaxID=3391666 RepID=UPI0039A69DEE
MDAPDNHAHHLLQEMGKVQGDVGTRIDGIPHILTLMAGHTYDLESRFSKLENGNSAPRHTVMVLPFAKMI